MREAIAANNQQKKETYEEGHNRQHNDGNNSFLGTLLSLRVEVSNGIAG